MLDYKNEESDIEESLMFAGRNSQAAAMASNRQYCGKRHHRG